MDTINVYTTYSEDSLLVNHLRPSFERYCSNVGTLHEVYIPSGICKENRFECEGWEEVCIRKVDVIIEALKEAVKTGNPIIYLDSDIRIYGDIVTDMSVLLEMTKLWMALSELKMKCGFI